jgi:hypothetical protein
MAEMKILRTNMIFQHRIADAVDHAAEFIDILSTVEEPGDFISL